ncbi:GAF domain-containing protein [Streptomyces sp. 4F14]|uniref:GAF domain-containing protein n=1 Tax=Streptomyces sp. 4F14 TaxID=3394380 RepID=UPI003A8B7C7F
MTDRALRPPSAAPDAVWPSPGLVRADSDCVSAHDVALDARLRLIRQLGLVPGPDPVFDEIAEEMATAARMAYAMVNLFFTEQTFVGLHQPPPGSGYVTVDRTMSIEHGWCPHVVERRLALPLPNVHAHPRFSSNIVVDSVGILSYFGAPLIDPGTGIVIGTVCLIDPEARSVEDAVRISDITVASAATVMQTVTGSAPAPH